MKPELFRLKRAAYPYFRRVIARFSDMDSERHLNNVALAAFYEDGRVSFLNGLRDGAPWSGYRMVVAHLSISYLAEAQYPGDYDVGLGVTGFGRTSFGIGCGLFSADICVGVCDTIQVAMGDAGPIQIPPALHKALSAQQLRLPG